MTALAYDVRNGMAEVRRAQKAQGARPKLRKPSHADACVVCKRPIPPSAVCVPAVTSCRHIVVADSKAATVIEQQPVGAICMACLQKSHASDNRTSSEEPCSSP